MLYPKNIFHFYSERNNKITEEKILIGLSLVKITLKLTYGIDGIVNLIKKYVRGIANETGVVLVYIDKT